MRKRKLRVIVFPGGFNWPIWVAQEKGFFEQEGLMVEITPTPGSVYQMTHLIAGDFDIAHTAFDNVVAYVEGQAEAPVEERPDLISFMGGDNGLLRLITIPEVTSYDDLRGRQLSVDAMTTGYSFVLREMLASNGIGKDDYELAQVGGVMQRWKTLMKSEHAGTLLVTPFEVLARSRGFNVLGSTIDVLDHYQGYVGTASRAWAQAHEDELVSYIRAYLAGLTWLYNTADRKQLAIDLLLRNTDLPPKIAEEAHTILIDPVHGISPSAALDMEGVRTALMIRNRYANLDEPLKDPSKYVDSTYYNRAKSLAGFD